MAGQTKIAQLRVTHTKLTHNQAHTNGPIKGV